MLDTAAFAEEEATRLSKDALGLRTLLHRAIRDTETLLADQPQDGITSGQHIMVMALEVSQVALISRDDATRAKFGVMVLSAPAYHDNMMLRQGMPLWLRLHDDDDQRRLVGRLSVVPQFVHLGYAPHGGDRSLFAEHPNALTLSVLLVYNAGVPDWAAGYQVPRGALAPPLLER